MQTIKVHKFWILIQDIIRQVWTDEVNVLTIRDYTKNISEQNNTAVVSK